MKAFNMLLLAFVLVAGSVALVGCETERQTEVEADGDTDVDTELTFDDEAIDEAEAELKELGDDIEAGAREAGVAIQDAARDVSDAIRDVSDAIDENVDLGDNAGTPEVDDNN
ncbi:hypothetical protein [Rubrivirga sp. IMCC45206]|uniref:hypothetical protein n=1 Tax=Rubrivirga sp. IMCC45206 TaxID=3391614 RepID=UPI0039900D13